MGMIERTCWCGKKFNAREADVKRGWAKACCKSHAAHAREKKLDRFGYGRGESGRLSSRMSGDFDDWLDEAMYEAEIGWDAHKDAY